MSISPRPSSDSTSTSTVFQLRAVLRGSVSPLIWRRLLVPADSSIAELHATLQTVFGWDDEHLHRFVIHGVEYGLNHFAGHSATTPTTSGSRGWGCGSPSDSPTDTTSPLGGKSIYVWNRCCPPCLGGAIRAV